LDVVFTGAGVFDVGLQVSDGNETTQCGATVTIADGQPPSVSLSVTPHVLWPPNHKMIPITTQITVADTCDPSPEVFLSSIGMDEGDETDAFDPSFDQSQGDGHTTNDIEVAADGTIYLRAERSGKGDGRVYTITFTARDQSGNTALISETISVPHNQ
jgi:hypothetical protein